MPTDLAALTVANAVAWKQWLGREAAVSSGVWLTLAKKGTTEPTTLTYMQALEEALCYGWIDGQTRKLDEATYTQRFTPRTAKSTWSQRNVGFVADLEAAGRMQPQGREAVEKAKADGRWNAAYAGSKDAVMPPELLSAIAADADAQAAWDKLGKTARFAIYLQIQNLKTDAGRKKRIESYVANLTQNKAGHVGTVAKKAVPKARKVEVGASSPMQGGQRTRSGRISKK